MRGFLDDILIREPTAPILGLAGQAPDLQLRREDRHPLLKVRGQAQGRGLTQADIEASRAPVALGERGNRLLGIELSQALKVEGGYILELGGASAGMTRPDDELRPALESILEGKVWLVQKGSSDRRFLEDLLFPVRVLTVNTVWLPDGTKRTKVIVQGLGAERHSGDSDRLRGVARAARGMELLLETECEALLRAEH
jgi:hypothetical protein